MVFRDGVNIKGSGFNVQGSKVLIRKQRTVEPQNIEYRISKGGFASLSLLYNKTEYIPSIFYIQDSIFDIRCFQPLNPEPLNLATGSLLIP